MTPEELSREQLALTSYLVDRVCGRALGRLDDYCIRNYPHDVYFIGNLRSQEQGQHRLGTAPHIPELINKLAPTAFGAEFNIEPHEGARVHVELSWSSYYRVFPTYAEQRQHQEGLNIRQARSGPDPNLAASQTPTADDDEDDNPPAEEIGSLGDDGEADAVGASATPAATTPASATPTPGTPGPAATGQSGGARDILMLRFKKVLCSAAAYIKFDQAQDGNLSVDSSDLEQAIDLEIRRVLAIVGADTEAARAEADLYAQIRVPDAALRSSAAFDQFLASLRTPITPSWAWEVRPTLRSSLDAGRVIFSLIFANDSSRQLSSAGKDNPHIESFLFDTHARFIFENCTVSPFTINLAPKGFRYDRYLPAQGFNCAVEPVEQGASDFITLHAPIYEQRRYQTRSQPEAPFAELANNPVPVLDRILTAMEGYREVWDRERERYIREISGWEAKHGQEFDNDRRIFEEEISNFRAGRNLIRDNPDILFAFRLTNETFRRLPKKTSWRLFQIVFLVAQLPGLCSLGTFKGTNAADFEKVDIVYFPTGGGKTEAYLAVLVFQCFFDRLRGKTAGVTSWIRFPLRLLTLQQTQRVADAIGTAEIVRREQKDQRLNSQRVSGFGVGYFVGKTSTPNEIVNLDQFGFDPRPEERATWETANDAQARQAWRRLMYCPSCKTPTVRVDFDTTQTRLLHACTNPGCKFPNGRIPIYVIDNEIYRYLPAVLVGTIDKLASVGNQRKMAQLFGSVDGACRVHGFFKGTCCQKECDGKQLQRTVPDGLSGPTLFIQDELHLLKEGLGTFDGHYETFTRELLSEIRPGARQKIIASSATIENFARQIEHLYAIDQAQARRFPGAGPSLGQSFYAETLPYPQRRYVGIIPHNKTIFNAMLELLEYYHFSVQEVARLGSGSANPYGGRVLPGTGEWLGLLDLYVTSTTYFQGNREMNSMRRDLEDHVNPILESAGYDVVKIIEMTGATSTDDVATALEFLERPKPGAEPATSVLATQMISHGVDIDRLNAMFFYGMPKQNAEYIQASSRVGRTNVGMVFVCHHPARERDQSHYSLFNKFHQYLGQLVEPVAINRWAKFSINRTLPGLFMGVLLQLLSYRDPSKKPGSYYMANFVRREMTDRRIRQTDFIEILEKAYDVRNGNDAARAAFRDEILTRVPQFFDQIIAAQNEQWVSNALIPRPMTSLRDVDDPIVVNLDANGSQWASRGGG